VGPSTVAVSIMAGTPLANVRALAGVTDAVRAMPNTPAALGKGVTALFTGATNKSVSAMAEMLFSPAGATVWLDSEGQFDAVTALSGSGPAYVFRFIEALGAAGEAAGLPVDLAECLARATVIGAAALAESDPRGIAELRQAVTSPGGTTEAGLEALDSDPGLPQLMRNTIRAAATRSRELADNR
jgi:pyrroline-5-carboxylate reductase